MAKIHAIHANGSLPRPTLWHKMHNYFTLVKNEISPRYEIGEGSRRRCLCRLRVIPPPFFWLRPPNPELEGLQSGLLRLCPQAELGRSTESQELRSPASGLCAQLSLSLPVVVQTRVGDGVSPLT